MKKFLEKLMKYSWILGFCGLLGFIPQANGNNNYEMFMFFAFFAMPLHIKIESMKQDERLIENMIKAKNICLGIVIVVLFLLVKLLSRNIPKTISQLLCVFTIVGMFFIYPIIFFKLDNK